MTHISLNGQWRGSCIRPDGSRFDMDASVPGSSIADLIRAGELPGDIFYRDNADAVAKFENCDYEYSRAVTAPEGDWEDIQLVFARLDTYCDIYLNEKPLGSADDEHIPHVFDVKNLLKPGENTLRLYFHSPVKMVEGRPAHSGAFTTERMNTRRTQCTYGWDWVARFISCGINGDVELRTWAENDMRVDGMYVYTKISTRIRRASALTWNVPRSCPGGS